MKMFQLKKSDLLIALAMVVVFAWVITNARGQDSVEYHHARSAIAIAYHLDDDETDSDICPACNGAGEVGDGRIMHKCEECDGTGKRTTMVAQLDIDDTQDDEYPALQKSFDYIENQHRRTCENPKCDCKNCDCENCTCGEIIEPPNEPVLELPPVEPEPIQVEWSEEQPVTEPPGKFYLLSEDWCKSCPQGKRNATLAGIKYEVVTVQQAADLGLIPIEPTSIPRLIYSLNTDDPLVGAVPVAKMESWAKSHPQPVTPDPIITATIHAEPSVAATLAALAEHLARTQDVSAVPVGGLFDKDVQAPVIVPGLLNQLMAGETLEVPDAGLAVSWSGENRTVGFPDKESITLSPPVSVKLTKWGLSVNTILRGCTVTDEGRTVQFDLKGPNFTVRFVQ